FGMSHEMEGAPRKEGTTCGRSSEPPRAAFCPKPRCAGWSRSRSPACVRSLKRALHGADAEPHPAAHEGAAAISLRHATVAVRDAALQAVVGAAGRSDSRVDAHRARRAGIAGAAGRRTLADVLAAI